MELRAALRVQDPELYQQKLDEVIPLFQLDYDEEIKKLLETLQPAMS